MMLIRVDNMGENFTIDEILNKTNNLYDDFEDTDRFIKKIITKYNVEESYSHTTLISKKSHSYEVLLSNLVLNNLDEADDYIMKVSGQLKKIRILALSEIAHKKLKEISFLIDHPLFFRKIRTDHRILINELNNLDDEALNVDDDEKIASEFENIIERLNNIEYEIEEETKSGYYGGIVKSAVWGLPLLIGLYQLIAMNFIAINPYIPLIFYVISLIIVYLFLKSATQIKLLYFSSKNEKFKGSITTSFVSFIVVILMLIVQAYTGKLDLNNSSFLFVAAFMMAFIFISSVKNKINKNKKILVLDELEKLSTKYGIEFRTLAQVKKLYSLILK